MATEIAFAKSFLSLLDAKPHKISQDHVEDPKNYQHSPITLPRPKRPFSRPSHLGSSSGQAEAGTGAPGSEPSVTVIARSPRNPPLEITLKSQSTTTTSVLDIKQVIASQTGIALPKIKLLFNKKPVADTKTIRDILVGGEVPKGGEVEFGVMVLGGAASLPASPPPAQTPPASTPEPTTAAAATSQEQEQGRGGGEEEPPQAKAPVMAAPGQVSGEEVLTSQEFWGDLEGFLQQRVRDEAVAKRAAALFRDAWAGK